MTRVTVFLKSEWANFFGLPPESLTTELEAADEEAVAAVIASGAEAFGISIEVHQVHQVSFKGAEDTTFVRLGYPQRIGHVPGVDDAGRVFWAAPRALSVGDLLRADWLVPGDCRCLELVPQVAAGGIGPIEWHALMQALHTLWQAADSLSPVLNVIAIGELLRRVATRVHPAEAAVARSADDWRGRGGDPWDLFALLSARPWRSDDVAGLLDCSRAEAEALLWGWGFAFDETAGVWAWDDGEEAEIIRTAISSGLRASEVGVAAVEAAVRDAIEKATRGVESLPDSVTVIVEEYGFMMFPEVWDGPKWATFKTSERWRRRLGLDLDWESPHSQPRGRTIELRVGDAWTLGAVLNAAADEFGIALSNFIRDMYPGISVVDKINGVAFYASGDEATWIPKQRFARRLPVVAEDGVLSIIDYRHATLGGLRRASELGLIVGDVLHPYLRPQVSAGAMGGPGEWANVVFALRELWKLLDDLAPAANLIAFGALAGALIKRLRGNAKTVEKVAPTLEQRGIRPVELKLLLERRRWALAEVSGLLGMGIDDAAEVLASLGFEAIEDDVWEVSDTPGASLVAVSVDIATYSTTGDEEQVRGRIRYAIDVTMKTGHAPGLQAVCEDPALNQSAVDDDESD